MKNKRCSAIAGRTNKQCKRTATVGDKCFMHGKNKVQKLDGSNTTYQISYFESTRLPDKVELPNQKVCIESKEDALVWCFETDDKIENLERQIENFRYLIKWFGFSIAIILLLNIISLCLIY